jgi:hypothetical protein
MHSNKVKAASPEELFKASKGTLHSGNTGDFCVPIDGDGNLLFSNIPKHLVLSKRAVNVKFTCFLSKRGKAGNKKKNEKTCSG